MRNADSFLKNSNWTSSRTFTFYLFTYFVLLISPYFLIGYVFNDLFAFFEVIPLLVLLVPQSMLH